MLLKQRTCLVDRQVSRRHQQSEFDRSAGVLKQLQPTVPLDTGQIPQDPQLSVHQLAVACGYIHHPIPIDLAELHHHGGRQRV